MSFRPLRSLFLIVSMLIFATSSNAEISRKVEIERLVQEVPPLETYGNVAGSIWLRQEEFRLKPDGAMEKDSLWVVFMTDRLNDSWVEDILSVPHPGGVHIQKAQLFDPLSGRLVRNLKPELVDKDGFRTYHVDLGDHDELVLVLSFTQRYDRHFSVDALIKPQGILPLWEGQFSVDYPAGAELYVKSNGVNAPKKTEKSGLARKTWSIYNLYPVGRESLLIGREPYIMFSLREGRTSFLQFLRELENRPFPELSGAFSRLTRMGDKTKAGKRLLSQMSSTDKLIPSSNGMIRENIPVDGPWTEWERAFLLSKWLRSLGWRAEVLWQTFLPIEKEGFPATMANLSTPVLRLAQPGSDYWFYLVGQQVEPGEVPAALRGKKLYGGSIESGFKVCQVDQGETAEHRLTLEWNLKLRDDGLLDGDLRVWVRNGWIWLYPDPSSLSLVELEKVLPGISSWYREGKINVSALDYGYRLDVPVSKMTGIPGGPGMLLRLPCLIPGSVLDLTSSQSTGQLKFPFVLEQKYSVKLPDNFKLMSSVPVRDFKEGDMKFEERFRFSKKHNSLEAQEKIITWSSNYDDMANMGLKRLVGSWMRWTDLSVPLVKVR